MKKTGRTFAVCTAGAAALCVLALPAAPAPAHDKAVVRQQDAAAKESSVRRPMVNVKPLQDVLAEAGEFISQGKLGPEMRVDVTATGERNDDGTLKPDTVVLNWTTGSDEAATLLAHHLVMALSQSKLFGPLEGAKEVSIRLRLDEANALLSVTTDMPSAEDARKLSEGYGMMVTLAAMSRKGTSEGEIYKSIKFSSDGKRFAFTFEMQREALGRIIDEVLAKRGARAGG